MHFFKILAAVLLLSSPALAAVPLVAADEPAPTDSGPQKLGFFIGTGYLGSPGANGAAVDLGVRLGLGRHFAFSFDIGYGMITATASPIVHDRWWLIPTMAFVIPAGRVRFDLGTGIGIGTSSGYTDMADFAAAPFMPSWAFQLVPVIRGHAMATTAINRRVDLFVRLDVASLLLDGNSIGIRDGNPNPGLIDTMWVNLWLGVQFRAL